MIKSKIFGGTLFIAVVLGAVFFTGTGAKVFADTTVTATTDQVKAATIEWVDAAHLSLSVAGQTVTFSEKGGGILNDYEAQTCGGKTSIFSAAGDGSRGSGSITNGSLALYYMQTGQAGGSCQRYNFDKINVGNTQNADIYWKLSDDQKTISPTYRGPLYHYQEKFPGSSSKLIFAKDSGQCYSRAIVDFSKGDVKGNAVLWNVTTHGGIWPFRNTKLTTDQIGTNNCYDDGGTILGNLSPAGDVNSGDSIHLGNMKPSSDPGNPAPPVTSGVDNPQGPDINCTSSYVAALADPLNWFLCPIEEGLVTVSRGLDNAIQGLLQTNTCQLFGGSKCSSADQGTAASYKSAWNNIRKIALGLLVIVGLVVVISQATGMELFDAYAIKKIMPRLLIAAVAITLSWQLMEFFVTLSNGLGFGIREIIYTPFSTLNQSITLGGGGTVVAGLITASAITAMGLLGLLSFAATAFLTILVAFGVLIIRQMVIIALILVAPIAILCYILPNTNNLFKIWWDSLAKALMMFPLIIGFIAIGHVMAAVAKTSPGAVNSLLAFVAYFAPYLLLPLTFRFAGGALRNVGGMVNDKSRGGFDRLKKFRGGQINKNMHDLRTGHRLGEQGVTFRGKRYSPGKRLNTITRGLGTGYKGRFGVGDRGAAATDAVRDNATMEFMKTQKFQASSQNDPVLRAAAVGQSEGEAVQNLQTIFGYSETEAKQHAAQARATIGYGAKEQQAAAMQLVSTGTGYENIDQLQQTLAVAARGNSGTGSRLAGFANAETKKVGRSDLAPSFSTLNSLVQGQMGSEGFAAPNIQSLHSATIQAARGADVVTLLRGKPKQMEYLGQSLADNLDANWRIADDTSGRYSPAQKDAAIDEVLQSAALARQLDDSKSYASQENQEAVNRMMQDTEAVRNQLTPLVAPPVVLSGVPVPPLTPMQQRWKKLAPPPRNPNDPNLP